MLGDLLDNRYRIVRTLSKGGFGQTYIAKDTRIPGHPYCVLKHLKPLAMDAVQLDNARRLFESEAIALGRLGEHPQVPRLLAYFEEEGDFYIVQELIRGYPLSKELKSRRKWTEEQIYDLLHDVLSTLVFVHDRGVIHRDIKPDNLIRRQADRSLVLVDFGSVKQIQSDAPVSDETGQTIAIGTVGYMAMEQARGRPRLNSDLYSLGIIGIQAATGKKPKHFQEDFDTGELVWRDEAADLSDEMVAFLSKMVAYHFKDRYGDAKEALEALEHSSIATIEDESQTVMFAPNVWPQGSANDASAAQQGSLASSGVAGQSRAATIFPDVPLDPKDEINSRTREQTLDQGLNLNPTSDQGQVLDPTFIELKGTTRVFKTTLQPQGNSCDSLVNKDQEYNAPDWPDQQESSPEPLDPGAKSLKSNSENSLTSVEASGFSEEAQITPVPMENDSVDDVTVAMSNGVDVIHSGGPVRLRQEYRPQRSRGAAPLPKSQESVSSKRVSTSITKTVNSSFEWINRLVQTAKTTAQKAALPQLALQLSEGALTRRPSSKTILFGSIGTLVVLSLGIRGYLSIQQQSQLQSMLRVIQSQQQEAEYEKCWQQARQLQAEQLQGLSDKVYTTVLDLEGQCALSEAQQLAQEQDFFGAIAIAQSVPETSTSHYQQAQDSIREWFVLSVDQVEAEYAGGSVPSAIAMAVDLANNIPSNHPLQARVQLTTLKWSLEQNRWLKAQSLLDDRQWQDAIDQARPLQTLPPFAN
ncbi:MAG: protein kinase, partial [Leptolyngbyaceae cyanobacterium]